MITSSAGNILTVAVPPEGGVDSDGQPLRWRYFWSNRHPAPAKLRALNSAGWSIYTVLAGFAGNTREQSAIAGLQSIWADLDLVKAAPGTPYEDVLDGGYTTLLGMVKQYDLPMPSSIVESGGGLHVYWKLDAPVPVADWLVLAGRVRLPFRRAFGAAYDGQCTIDSMRLMRTPGFTNHRWGREATQVVPTDTAPVAYSYDQLLTAFSAVTPTAQELAALARVRHGSDLEAVAAVGAVLAGSGAAPPAVAGSVFAGAAPTERPGNWKLLRDGALQGAGCRLLAEVLRDGDVGYELWSGIFSLASHTDDLDGAINEIAGQWPDWGTRWSVDTVKQRVSSFTGPRSCVALRDAYIARRGSDPCAGCPHSTGDRAVKTPLALAYPGRVSLGEAPAQPLAQAADTQQVLPSMPAANVLCGVPRQAAPSHLPLPPSGGQVAFERRADGSSAVVSVVHDGGETFRHAVLTPALWIHARIRSIDTDGNPCYRHVWAVDQPSGTEFHEVPAATGLSGASTSLTHRLGNMGVRIEPDVHEKLANNFIGVFIRQQLKDAETMRAIRTTPAITHNGTTSTSDTRTFTLGDMVYGRDGSAVRGYVPIEARRFIEPVDPPTPDQVADLVSEWNHHLKACFGPAFVGGADRNTAARLCLALVLGAPLMPQLNLGGDLGGLVLLYTPHSGAGKTTVLRLLLSMYTHKHVFEVNKTTEGARDDRSFRLSTLPVHHNDVNRTLNTSDKDAVVNLLLAASDTTIKSRMTDNAGVAQRFRNTYSFMSANTDLVRLATQASGSDASIARVLRVPMLSGNKAAGAVTPEIAERFVAFETWARTNAGRLGHLWVRYAVQNQEDFAARAVVWRNRLFGDVPALASSRWRFLTNIALSALVGADAAQTAGLTPFDREEAYELVRGAIEVSLDRREELMAEQAGQLQALVLGITGTTLVRDVGRVGFDVDTPHMHGIQARIYPATRLMAIPRTTMASLVRKLGLNAVMLDEELAKAGARIEQLDIAEGLPQAAGKQACVVFNLAPTMAVVKEPM